MSEYIRMVSYFYRYQNGIRQMNTGFGKIEVRQDQLRMTLYLSDSKVLGNSKVSIYLYIYEKGIMSLLHIGEGQFRDGALSYQKECPIDDVLHDYHKEQVDKRIELNEYSGIVAYYDETLFYGSQWNEEPIRLKDLLRGKRALDEKNKNKTEIPILKKETIEAESIKECEVADRTSKAVLNHDQIVNNIGLEGKICNEENYNKRKNGIEEKYNREKSNTENHDNLEEKEDYEDINNCKKIDENQNTISGFNKEDSIQADEKKSSNNNNVFTQQIKREETKGVAYLLSHRESLPVFSKDCGMNCVKIQPQDIGMLQRENWQYGNNSFVMHGFYNYKYLMVGKITFEEGTVQYVLGVPGIFSNRNKYLADIFGFHEFLPIRKCPFMTGEFGYWIGSVKEQSI